MPPAPLAVAAGARWGGRDAGPYSAPAAPVWSAAFSAFLVSAVAPELVFHSRWFISKELPPHPSALPATPWALPQPPSLAAKPKTMLEIALLHLGCLLGEETDDSVT